MATTDDKAALGATPQEHLLAALPDKLNENLARVEELSGRLIAALTRSAPPNPGLSGPGADLFAKAGAAYWQEWVHNPAKVIEAQVEFWGESVRHFVEAQQIMAQSLTGEQPDPAATKDRRFSHPFWNNHPYFHYIKNQYLTNAAAMMEAIDQIEDLDATEKRRLTYFGKQIVEMMAPTNFLGTNPDALEKALETEGQSLVDGLENLVADLEANNGELAVRLVDETAFEVGRNIAVTPGKVVFRNRMFELLQYSPTTEKVHATPLIIFPPWINKFYILDLKQQNSMIKWLVDQGYTLFIVSWINPDPSYADVGLEDYIEEGYLAAIEQAKAITGQKQVNLVGYCIAGTTLALTLALLKKRKDTSVKSATFFTALTDFSDQGEFVPFLQNDFIDAIEEEVGKTGILESKIMARTFSFLRSNDLVYQPAIKSYMLGEAPPAFDLLFWNGDGANLPARMAVTYLRKLCQDNEFAQGGFKILGEVLHLSDVDVPLCSVACETDHIAAWKDCYRGFTQMGAKDKTFILAQSGHIAGIVNPPSKGKYGHYINEDVTSDSATWRENAAPQQGSWWPLWNDWLSKRSGRLVNARLPGDSGGENLGDAPGSYVLIKANHWKSDEK